MRFITLTVVCLFCTTSVQSGQVCNEQINFSAPDSRYLFGETDAVVIDDLTNLLWMRCPLGYELDRAGTRGNSFDDRCVETEGAIFDWQAALRAAVDLNAAGGRIAEFGEWRLPNTKELASLVENRCNWPSNNSQFFPDTPSANFWTNTPWRDTSAMAVEFSEGRIGSSPRNALHHVRLVIQL